MDPNSFRQICLVERICICICICIWIDVFVFVFIFESNLSKIFVFVFVKSKFLYLYLYLYLIKRISPQPWPLSWEPRMTSTAHVLMWLGAFVTYTLLMCPQLTQYETHKHYIAGSLKPWFPSASWVRGVSMGGPIALWTKDYNGFCDVSCGPLQRFAWLKAVSHNGTVPDHQMSHENLFGKMILKLITYFTQLI